MDRWLFFADTPLQMYNAALTASALIEQGDHASLLVYDQFAQASDLAIVYEKIGVFDEIEVVPSDSRIPPAAHLADRFSFWEKEPCNQDDS